MKVCITTAGIGSRMGPYYKINKALLPVDKQAAISRIIAQFPTETEFVIACGHNAQQVIDYLELAHPALNFTYVMVEKYAGPNTGPLLSLYACKEHLQEPFVFVASDTLFLNSVYPNENQLFYSEVYDHGYSYIHVETSDGSTVTTMSEQPARFYWWAFTGLMTVADYESFWIGAEIALSNRQFEIYHAVNESNISFSAEETAGWEDIGTYERYTNVIAGVGFDFSKPDEFIYNINNRIIKWFFDKSITTDRMQRAALLPEVFPKNITQRGEFLSYDYTKGHTLYEYNSNDIFAEFLKWMSLNVWEEQEADISSNLQLFYEQKTRERIQMFHDKYPDWNDPEYVNGTPVITTKDVLTKFDFSCLVENAIPSFVHGDLQFDNVICGENDFTLIDWRQNFGGRIDLGDLYYDLAKLLGGIRLNYSLVKRGYLTYEQIGTSVKLGTYNDFLSHEYEQQFWDFVAQMGFDHTNIENLLGIVFLNMAPLHHAPFDKFLYALGLRTLTKAL